MTVWIQNPFDNLPCEGYRKQRYWLMAEAFARAEAAEKLAKTIWLARALGSESPLPAGETETLLARWTAKHPLS